MGHQGGLIQQFAGMGRAGNQIAPDDEPGDFVLAKLSPLKPFDRLLHFAILRPVHKLGQQGFIFIADSPQQGAGQAQGIPQHLATTYFAH